MKIRLLVFLFVVTYLSSFSQRRVKYKYEIFGGLGVTNFLGELGGANKIGTNFVADLELLATRPLLTGGVRYKKHPRFAFKEVLSIGMLSGSDRLTKEPFRNNRNLSFRSPIIELSTQVEFYFTKDGPRKIYKISGLKSKKKVNLAGYLFTGAGLIYYAPQAKYNGSWYFLRKLGTEGQGLPGGPKKYSNFNMSIPLGIGLRYGIDRKLTLGVEFGVRKTFTDYIDDVSTKYYDNNAIKQNYGDAAAFLADPSLGDIPNATAPNADGTSAQRGDNKDKDAFMFFEVNLGYKFAKKRRTRSKF